jgi:carbonic anhydrase
VAAAVTMLYLAGALVSVCVTSTSAADVVSPSQKQLQVQAKAIAAAMRAAEQEQEMTTQKHLRRGSTSRDATVPLSLIDERETHTAEAETEKGSTLQPSQKEKKAQAQAKAKADKDDPIAAASKEAKKLDDADAASVMKEINARFKADKPPVEPSGALGEELRKEVEEQSKINTESKNGMVKEMEALHAASSVGKEALDINADRNASHADAFHQAVADAKKDKELMKAEKKEANSKTSSYNPNDAVQRHTKYMQRIIDHQKQLRGILDHLGSTRQALASQLEKAQAREERRKTAKVSDKLEKAVDTMIAEKISKSEEKLGEKLGNKLALDFERRMLKQMQDEESTIVRTITKVVKEEVQTAIADHVGLVENKTTHNIGHLKYFEKKPEIPEDFDGVFEVESNATKPKKKKKNPDEVDISEEDMDGKNSTSGSESDSDSLDEDEEEQEVTLDVDGKPNFSYSEKSSCCAPQKWGSMSDQYATCGNGREQSPINVQLFSAKASEGGAEVKRNVKLRPNMPPMQLGYQPFFIAKVQNNGHSIFVQYPQGANGTLAWEGKMYGLVHMKFHTPGEHTMNGERPGMELHLVHEAKVRSPDMNTRFVVVAIPFKVAEEGEPMLQLIMEKLPEAPAKNAKAPSVTMAKDERIWLNSALFGTNTPDVTVSSSQFYTYHGSMTQPPCEEDVKWVVMKKALKVSEKQLKAMADVLPQGSNARPVQNDNGHWAQVEVHTGGLTKREFEEVKQMTEAMNEEAADNATDANATDSKNATAAEDPAGLSKLSNEQVNALAAESPDQKEETDPDKSTAKLLAAANRADRPPEGETEEDAGKDSASKSKKAEEEDDDIADADNKGREEEEKKEMDNMASASQESAKDPAQAEEPSKEETPPPQVAEEKKEAEAAVKEEAEPSVLVEVGEQKRLPKQVRQIISRMWPKQKPAAPKRIMQEEPPVGTMG